MSADGPCVNFPAAVPAAPKPCPSSKVPAAVVEAIEKGDVAAVEKWFADDSAADPNALCEDGWSLLVRAAHHGHDDLIKALVKRGGDINRKDHHGVSPLVSCVASPHTTRKNADLMLYHLDPTAEVERGAWCVLRQKGWIC